MIADELLHIQHDAGREQLRVLLDVPVGIAENQPVANRHDGFKEQEPVAVRNRDVAQAPSRSANVERRVACPPRETARAHAHHVNLLERNRAQGGEPADRDAARQEAALAAGDAAHEMLHCGRGQLKTLIPGDVPQRIERPDHGRTYLVLELVILLDRKIRLSKAFQALRPAVRPRPVIAPCGQKRQRARTPRTVEQRVGKVAVQQLHDFRELERRVAAVVDERQVATLPVADLVGKPCKAKALQRRRPVEISRPILVIMLETVERTDLLGQLTP